MATKKKDVDVRARVTIDLDLGQFWEEDNTLAEIQARAENMVHDALNDLLRYEPKIVGDVHVTLSGTRR